MHHYPEPFLKLLSFLKKLPGVGTKSAERFAFHILEWSQKDRAGLADHLAQLHTLLSFCKECGCLMEEEPCAYCHSPRRNPKLLAVVAHFRDIYSIEGTHEFHGLYHVLGGVLSPLEGKGPEQLNIPHLLERVKQLGVDEVIIALDSTLEGDATALYLKHQLEHQQIAVSRLAFGLPMGSSLDYVDGGTLARALVGRGGF